MQMLGSPFPVLCGLNASYDKVVEEVIPEFQGGSIVYVFLDHQHIVASHDVVESTMLPVTNDVFTRIEQSYIGLFHENQSSSVDVDGENRRFFLYPRVLKSRQAQKIKASLKKELLMAQGEEQQLFLDFLELMRVFLNNTLIDFLPETFQHKKEGDRIEIDELVKAVTEGKHEDDVEFYKMIGESQMYAFFVNNLFS